MIKPAYSVSFLLSINIFVWQNVLYFPNDLRTIRDVTNFDMTINAGTKNPLLAKRRARERNVDVFCSESLW